MSSEYALLIVGGGPAGLAAARGYRAAGGAGRVAIVGDEARMPYNRPSLTKELLRGEASESDLPLEEEAWLTEQRVDLIDGRAVRIDATERIVTLSGGRKLAFAECVLATGAEPSRLPVPGADHPGVRVLRSLDHLRELLARLGDDGAAAVIGSGFIGCEIASSLRLRGHAVTLLSDEEAPNAARLGPEAAAIIAGWLADDGVDLRLGGSVQRIESIDGHLVVEAEGARARADVVVMAAGVRPRTELAQDAGLALDDSGAVAVTASMRSSREGLLAAGDVCGAENRAAGRRLRVEHWGDALAQGEIAGRTAAGASAAWDEVPGFWSTIGRRTLKYAAWGDGYDEARLEPAGDGGFVVRYGREGRLVGILTHEADSAYATGRDQVAVGAQWS